MKTLLGVILCFLSVLPTWASDTLYLHQEEANHLVAPQYLQIYEDSTLALTISDVTRPAFARYFAAPQDASPSTSQAETAYWVKFTLAGEALQQQNWYLEALDPRISHMDIYYRNTSGSLVGISTGQALPFHARDYRHKNFVVDLPNDQEALTLYVRIQSKNWVSLLFKVRTDRYFIFYSLKEYFLLGLFYGTLLIMGIYNGLLFIATKERSYIYYLCYVISAVLISFSEDGLGFHFLWTESPMLNQWVIDYSPLLFMFCFLFYASSFLEMPRYMPRFRRAILLTAVAVAALSLLLGGRVGGLSWNLPVYLLPFTLLYAATITSVRRGVLAARFFLVSYSFVMASIAITVVRYNQLLAWDNIFTIYILNFSLLFELLLLSLAQAYKYRRVKDDRAAAQAESINHLQRINQMQLEAKEEIERQVQEQAGEIIEQNHIIENQNEELTTANEQLQAQSMKIQQMNERLNKQNENLRGNIKELTKARVLMQNVDFSEFSKIFPSEEACYSYLEELKWRNGFHCSKCQHTEYIKGQGHNARKCKNCNYNESCTAHTIFHRNHIPIQKAFYLLFLIYANKDSITVRELSEILDLRTATCWKFGKKVKDKMANIKHHDYPEELDGWSRLILDPAQAHAGLSS